MPNEIIKLFIDRRRTTVRKAKHRRWVTCERGYERQVFQEKEESKWRYRRMYPGWVICEGAKECQVFPEQKDSKHRHS
jgi:hypothetical protein